LVQIGAEEGAVERYNEELTRSNAVIEGNGELLAILSNPAYAIEAKREILKDVIGKLGLSPIVSNFLQLLLDRGRLEFLSEIAESYGVFADELSGIVRPVLTSAFPLENARIEEMKAALAKVSGKQVQLQVQVDPSLIGGIVATIGDKVFDGSVKTQLERIKDTLQKG
jgi:F-type H+-transporting ATPase subunit delta